MPKEKCVVCGAETPYEFETHIDFRTGYVEGVGQHCIKCYNRGTQREMITIPKSFVKDYSNDMELGHEVRSFYYKNYND